MSCILILSLTFLLTTDGTGAFAGSTNGVSFCWEIFVTGLTGVGEDPGSCLLVLLGSPGSCLAGVRWCPGPGFFISSVTG